MFYSLGRFHPEEIKLGKRKQSGQISQPGCKKRGKELTGPRAWSPGQEEDKDVNRGRRREEDEGNEEKEWRMWEPAAVPPLCKVWHQNIGEGERGEKKTWRKEYRSDNTLLRALKSAVSTHAIWIELCLAFQWSPFLKLGLRTIQV